MEKKKKKIGGWWVKTCKDKGLWERVEEGKERKRGRWEKMDGDVERQNQGPRKEWNEYVSVYCTHTLALFLLCVCVWDNLPFRQTEYAQKGEKVKNTGQNHGLKRKFNKTWKCAFIFCTPYIVCHPSTQTSRAEPKQKYMCRQQKQPWDSIIKHHC